MLGKYQDQNTMILDQDSNYQNFRCNKDCQTDKDHYCIIDQTSGNLSCFKRQNLIKLPKSTGFIHQSTNQIWELNQKQTCDKDGIKAFNEECDDGDTESTGGYLFTSIIIMIRCDSNCRIKEKWTCLNKEEFKSICFKNCIEHGMTCLDQNYVNQDGQNFKLLFNDLIISCDNKCKVEKGYSCSVTSNNGQGYFQCFKSSDEFQNYQTNQVIQVQFIVQKYLLKFQINDYSKYLDNSNLNTKENTQLLRKLTQEQALCKNGKLEIGEQCDDGEDSIYDYKYPLFQSNFPRCDQECNIQPGYGAIINSLGQITQMTHYCSDQVEGITLILNASDLQITILQTLKPIIPQLTNGQCYKNGILEQYEECDDGDLTNSGGQYIPSLFLICRCDQYCFIKSGWTCIQQNEGGIQRCIKSCTLYVTLWPGLERYYSKFQPIRHYYNTTNPTLFITNSPSTETTTEIQTTTQFTTPKPQQSTSSPSYTTFTVTTTTPPRIDESIKCGNNFLEFGEECDDVVISTAEQCREQWYMGHLDNLPTDITRMIARIFPIHPCSSQCLIESQFSCFSDFEGQYGFYCIQKKDYESWHTYAPPAPTTIYYSLNSQCDKNGIVEAEEICDNGLTNQLGYTFSCQTFDRCDDNCRVRPGWSCVSKDGKKSHCYQSCIYVGTECLDRNHEDGDGFYNYLILGVYFFSNNFNEFVNHKITFELINNNLNANQLSYNLCYLNYILIHFQLNIKYNQIHLTYYNNYCNNLNYNYNQVDNYKLTNYNHSQINNYKLADNNHCQINNYKLTNYIDIDKIFNYNSITQNYINWNHLSNHNGNNQTYYYYYNQTINHSNDNQPIIYYNFNNDYYQGTQNYQFNKHYTSDGEEVTCSDMKVCPNGSRPPCNWKRKTYTGCREKDNSSNNNHDDKKRRFLQTTGNTASIITTATATLRIKTNSLPNHCFSTQESTQSTENDIDFEVEYRNSAKKSKTARILTENRILIALDGKDQDIVNSILCETAWTSTELVQQVSPSYTEYSGNYKDIVGIAINGVPLHTGNSEYGSDIFFPKKYKEYQYSNLTIELDSCLGSVQFLGFYHYYGWSPCILPSGPIKTSSSSNCKDIDECKNDKLAYSISFMKPQEKNMTVIGIARDGHSILGPFRSDGN
ncbi:UNKNOWN [Stylonychia lemnae]|uniref:Uncharacterized protein n=1 Tax=Stylonychia lemnae TaxID=5949 RepID=A0A078B756_STYLE|nr:UNKNOWN [Stylonychia lemnae]|eukprot:CDW89137.1 UNKNOWN [Stylonychia lemnae]